MKKQVLLNQPASTVIAGMGHMDTLVIADAGLPIPPSTQRIDLAVSKNIPLFEDVVKAVLSELEVESAIIAEEMAQHSPAVLERLQALLGDIPIQRIPHHEFKTQTSAATAILRTGEFTPYANVILVAGVVF